VAGKKFEVLQKIEDMIDYAYDALAQFPKAEKFSLAQDIRFCMNALLRHTVTAEKKASKKTSYEHMDVELAVLQSYVRISMKKRYISIHKFGVWSGMLVEIGKMIGGLLKSVSDKPKS